MKKLGRKRSASSISKEENSENQRKINGNVKSTLQTSVQPRISSFFGKTSRLPDDKKIEADNKTEPEATNSINKHVNNFKRRLSLGGKKTSKVNIRDTAPKVLDSVNEETGGLEDNSNILSIPNENLNTDNINSCRNKNERTNVESETTTESLSLPNKTSTPKNSLSIHGNNRISKMAKQSNASDEGDMLSDDESRKRQKLSTSVEKLYQDNNLAQPDSKIQKSSIDCFKMKKQLDESVTKDFSINEFEFENSTIQENDIQEYANSDKKCDKLPSQNTENNFESSIDEKELADALDEDFFNEPDSNSKSVITTRNNTKPGQVEVAKKQPLSFYYGRHLVESVSINAEWGDVYLKVKRVTHSSIKKFQSRQNVCDNDGNVINGAPRDIVLRGSWAQSSYLKKGDIINILDLGDELEEEKELVIDDSSSALVIVNPDMLMAGTSIVSTLFCMRKAVLSEWYKGLDSSNRTMFVGTLLHDVLQTSLKNNVKSLEGIQNELDASLKSPSVIQDMLTLKLNSDEIRKEVDPFLVHILFFIEKYVIGANINPPPPAYSSSTNNNKTNGRITAQPDNWLGKVDEIRDIEENIWSPRLGIKGKVDLTLHVKLQKRDKQGRNSKTVPLELKTGRPSNSAEHRGQVILYSMMMSERWPDPQSGLLLYLRNSSLTEVQAGIHEIRGLVQLRNQLVHFISGKNMIKT